LIRRESSSPAPLVDQILDRNTAQRDALAARHNAISRGLGGGLVDGLNGRNEARYGFAAACNGHLFTPLHLIKQGSQSIFRLEGADLTPVNLNQLAELD
jgi:hypothetical protein